MLECKRGNNFYYTDHWCFCDFFLLYISKHKKNKQNVIAMQMEYQSLSQIIIYLTNHFMRKRIHKNVNEHVIFFFFFCLYLCDIYLKFKITGKFQWNLCSSRLVEKNVWPIPIIRLLGFFVVK